MAPLPSVRPTAVRSCADYRSLAHLFQKRVQCFGRNIDDRECGSTEPFRQRRKITFFRLLLMASDGEVRSQLNILSERIARSCNSTDRSVAHCEISEPTLTPLTQP